VPSAADRYLHSSGQIVVNAGGLRRLFLPSHVVRGCGESCTLQQHRHLFSGAERAEAQQRSLRAQDEGLADEVVVTVQQRDRAAGRFEIGLDAQEAQL